MDIVNKVADNLPRNEIDRSLYVSNQVDPNNTKPSNLALSRLTPVKDILKKPVAIKAEDMNETSEIRVVKKAGAVDIKILSMQKP